MNYVYLLHSSKYRQIYVGSTNNLVVRYKQHQNGEEFSTKRYRPWKLIYYEAFVHERLARRREQRLKHHGGAMNELKKRIGLLPAKKITGAKH